MSVQVLVATMHQKNHNLLEKMNIQSDAIIANQCDSFSREKFSYYGHIIEYINCDEKGVGLNRNNALMRASSDYCIFADDDMRYVDNYPQLVEDAFQRCPKADVIIFNLIEHPQKRYVNKKVKRIRRYNYLRYGAARIAIRLKSIRDNGISFNLCFGGGTEHCSGEDNLFLTDCFNKGLKIYANPIFIAELLNDRESSWFKGYNEKYLKDKGCLFRTISKKWWKILCLQDAIRKHKLYDMSFLKMLKLMIKNG